MADKLTKVDYFYATMPNKPGQGAKVMNGLAEAGVNLLAFSAFPSGRKSQLDLVPEDSAKLKRAAKAMGLKLSVAKKGFLLVGDDRVGAVTGVLNKLAAAKINITAIDAVCSGGRYGALFWVKPPKVAKAAKVLGAK
ncbi:MAG: hypothetical protein U1F15_00155 [Burkholderiales bacterium]